MIIYENAFAESKIKNLKFEESFLNRYENITSENCQNAFRNVKAEYIEIPNGENIKNAQYMFYNASIENLNTVLPNIVNAYYMSCPVYTSDLNFQHVENITSFFKGSIGNVNFSEVYVNMPKVTGDFRILYGVMNIGSAYLPNINVFGAGFQGNYNNIYCPNAALEGTTNMTGFFNSNVGTIHGGYNVNNPNGSITPHQKSFSLYIKKIENIEVDNLYYENLFNGCSNLFSVENINANNIYSENAQNMFRSANNFKTLPNLDYSKVVNADNMFVNTQFSELSNADFRNVEVATNMFQNATTKTLDNISFNTSATGFTYPFQITNLLNCNFVNATKFPSGVTKIINCNFVNASNTVFPGIEIMRDVDLSTYNGSYTSLFVSNSKYFNLKEFENVTLGPNFNYNYGSGLLMKYPYETVPDYNEFYINFTEIRSFAENSKLTKIENINFYQVINAQGAFRNCKNLSVVNNCDFSNVSNSFNMFYNTNIIPTKEFIESFSSLKTRKNESQAIHNGCVGMFTETPTSNIMFCNELGDTDINGMFRDCRNIVDFPNDFSNSDTSIKQTFSSCGISNISDRDFKPAVIRNLQVSYPNAIQNQYINNGYKFIRYTIPTFSSCKNITNISNFKVNIKEPNIENFIADHVSDAFSFEQLNYLTTVNNCYGLSTIQSCENLISIEDSEFYFPIRFHSCYNLVSLKNINIIGFIPNTIEDFLQKENSLNNAGYTDWCKTMFYACRNLVEIPNEIFDKIANILNGCKKLEIGQMFGLCNNLSNDTIHYFIENFLLNPDLNFRSNGGVATGRLNLFTNNQNSPFYQTKFNNSYYTNYISALQARGFYC